MAQAYVADIQGLHGSPPGSLEQVLKALDQFASVKSYSRGQQIFGYCEEQKYLYRVRSGVVRKFALQPGGRRHILDLLLPGDFFGFGSGQEYLAEAAVDRTLVSQYYRTRVEALARSDGDVAEALQMITVEAIARLERQMLMLGKTTALEKVSCFLLEFASRINGQASDVLALPISRYDIGDSLAISSETVCRAMTELKHRGIISLQGPREVRIVDRDGLEA
jgi:CRP/FNR family transcriptional regulator, nitrogen fixation regulation protein